MTTTRARCDGSPGKPGQYEETRTQYSDGSEIVIKINCKGCVTCRPCESCGGCGKVPEKPHLSVSKSTCPSCKGKGTR